MKSNHTIPSLLVAAVAGLASGTTPALHAASLSPDHRAGITRAGALVDSSEVGEKHSCKGKNSCKGKGGCKTGDNGCKSKNSCKGKGGCATDGSKV